MRILVLDDNPDILTLIEALLTDDGHDVFTLSNGNNALKTIKNESDFDLVISDIFMPEKDGFEIIKEIKKNYPDIRILCISGYSDISNEPELYLKIAKKLGADFIF